MHFQGPIFICGTSRSGTTVLQAALDRSPRVRIALETHYFDDLRVAIGDAGARGPLDQPTRTRVEDYFLGLSHRTFGHGGDPEKGWMKRADLRAHAERLGGGGDAYFEAFCRDFAAREAATIWGEKTPRHVFRLTEMLERFPDARVVFMMRDPRAVVASYRDWKNRGGFDLEADPEHAGPLAAEEERTRKSYHPVTISLLWVAAARAAIAARARFGAERVRLQRYEELCAHPDRELGEIFDWLGIARPEGMTDVPVLNSSYEKYADKGGFVQGAVERWQKTLAPAEIAVVERCCGRLFPETGYRSIAPKAGVLATLPYFASAVPALARATWVNASRSGNVFKYVARRVRFLVGR